jgi:hypothetical protein
MPDKNADIAKYILPDGADEQLGSVKALGKILNEKERVQTGVAETIVGYGNFDNHNFRPVYETEPIYGYSHVYSESKRDKARERLESIYLATSHESVKKQVLRELHVPRMALDWPNTWALIEGLGALVLFITFLAGVAWAGMRFVFPWAKEYVSQL